jgi:putative copper export protein
MVTLTGADFVLWIHVLAACIWIGGQITLGMVMPMLRTVPDVMRNVARRFQNLAWGAFAILIVTGLINMHEAGISLANLNATLQSRTLSIKLVFVFISGAAAALHAYWVTPRMRNASHAKRAAAIGTLGGISLLAAMAAALFGVAIAQS